MKRWGKIISLALIALGCLVLIGWVLNIPFLKSILPNLAEMKPNTALSFLLTGSVLGLLQEPKSLTRKRFAQIGILLIFLMGFLTLSEYIFKWNLGLDQLLYQFLVSDRSNPPLLRMSEATALGFILLACGLFLLMKARFYVAAQLSALLVLGIGLLTFATYVFGAASLYSVFPFKSVALHTSLAFLASGLGILLISSKEGFVAVITPNYMGGMMARRLLPAVVLVPLIIGWLRLQGQYLGYYDTEFGLALYAVSNIIIFTMLVWWVARSLNRIDIQNQHANVQLENYGQRMHILHNIDRAIIDSQAIPDLIVTTIKELRVIIPCQRVAINLLDEATQEIVTYATDSDYAPLSVNRVRILPEMLEGFDKRNTRLFNDLRLVLDQKPEFNVFFEKGLVALLQVLLIQDETIQGTLSLAASTPNFFTPEYYEIAIEVAHQLTIAVKEMRLSDALAFHIAELETAKEALQKAKDTLEQRVIERTAELNAAKEQVEAILNNSLDGILLTDLNFIIQKANAAFAKLFGWNPVEIIGKSLMDIVLEDDKPRLTICVQAVLTGVNKNTIEVRARRKDGSIFDTELGIEHIEGNGLVSTIRDITERKAQERQLRYHASIQNTVADAVIVTDLEYRIQSWNKAAERIYGWRMEEVVGKLVRDVLQTEFSASQFAEEVRRVFTENGYWSGEVLQRRRDGSPIYMLSSTVLFKDSNDIPFGVLAVNHDISERKQAENVLRTALEREKEVNEMKTRFISTASHEFRTPLATIMMATESLMAYRHKMDNDKIDQKLDKIRGQVIHVAAIMDDVLASSRMHSSYTDFKPYVDKLDTLCQEIVQEFAERTELSNRIQYTSLNPNRMFAFDARLMRQIIVNLLSNALKYSANDQSVHLKLDQSAEQIILEVSDQGIGIPPQDQKYIFDPFHRAQNVGDIPGTGLGMSIIKKAVELHGGSISLKSELNQGTTFTLTFPVISIQNNGSQK